MGLSLFYPFLETAVWLFLVLLVLLAQTSAASACAIIGLLSYIAVSCAPYLMQESRYQPPRLFFLQSTALFVSLQVHPGDGELLAPQRFTSLTSSGGTLF